MKISPGKRHWGRGRGSSRREASFAPPRGTAGRAGPSQQQCVTGRPPGTLPRNLGVRGLGRADTVACPRG